MSDLYIPTIGLPILLEEICTVDRSWDYIIGHRHMNVEIGAEAALFPEKEYISGIFVAVQSQIMIILISYAELSVAFASTEGFLTLLYATNTVQLVRFRRQWKGW
jgi:hypothetical protein